MMIFFYWFANENSLLFTCEIILILLLTITLSQICDLPPGTISDISYEHNLTVHWTEKHIHRDCALYTGDTCSSLVVLHH